MQDFAKATFESRYLNSGSFKDQFNVHGKFNITNIETADLIHVPNVGYFIAFRCIDRSDCAQMGNDRGDGLQFRDVSRVNVLVSNSADSAGDMEQFHAFGLDLERWAVAMGGKIDANF